MDNKKLFIRDDDILPPKSMFVDPKVLRNVPRVKVPTTAEEYLVTVITERHKIKTITQCNVDYKQFRKNQSLFYDQEPLPYIADNLKPTKEWQNIQVADFSEVRGYISRMRKQISKNMRIEKLKINKDATQYWWQRIFIEYDPDLSIVLGFNAAQIDFGLDILIKLMKETKPGNTIHEYIGRWIYALLACMNSLVHSDTVSIMRNLAKQCWIVRSHINPECENAPALAAPLTLIICLVGHYYRQLDLADSLE